MDPWYKLVYNYLCHVHMIMIIRSYNNRFIMFIRYLSITYGSVLSEYICGKTILIDSVVFVDVIRLHNSWLSSTYICNYILDFIYETMDRV